MAGAGPPRKRWSPARSHSNPPARALSHSDPLSGCSRSTSVRHLGRGAFYPTDSPAMGKRGGAMVLKVRPILPLLGEIHEHFVGARIASRRALADLAERFPVLRPFKLEASPPEVRSTCEEQPACFRLMMPMVGAHYWSEGGSPLTDYFGANGELAPEVARVDYALSSRNEATRVTMAAIPRDAEVCACRAKGMNGRQGGRLQLWTPEFRRARMVLTR